MVREWKTLKGSEISTKITKGSSPNWQGFQYQDDGVLFVTSENVREGFVDLNSPKYLPLEFNRKQKNSILRDEDILINIVGASIGRVAKFHDSFHRPANVNQAVCVFRTKENVLPDFVLHYLQHPANKARLLSTQVDSARPNLSLTDIRNFTFNVPPLPEQRKIAEILSCWDRAIEKTEELIEKKIALKNALLKELVFKMEYPIQKIGPHIHLLTGYPFDSSMFSEEEGIKLLRGINITVGSTRWTNDKSRYWLHDINEYSKYNLEIGDLVIGMDGSLVGRNYAIIEDRDIPCLLVQRVARIRCKKDLLIEYLYAIVGSSYFIRYVDSVKTSSGIPHISAKQIKDFNIPLPSVHDQQRIISHLGTINNEIKILNQLLELHYLQKKGLMTKLFAGNVIMGK